MKRLFKARLYIDVMVAADDASQVDGITRMNAVREIEDYGEVSVSPIGKFSELSSEWEALIPYSNDSQETRTCKQILESIVEVKQEVQIQPKKTIKETAQTTQTTTEEAITITTTTTPQNRLNKEGLLRFKI
jgi:hypothetical protein